MKNKLIFVVFSILLILVGNSAAAGSTLRIENGTSKANDTITVNITALNVSDLSNFDITLSYNPSIVNVTNANNNPAFVSSLNNLEQASNGTIKLITFNTGSGQSGNVLLSTLTLRAVGSPGQKSYLNLTVNTFVNSIETDIPVGVENGTFNISGSTLKSIMISPSATTTLTVGGTQLFSATAIDQNDNPITGIKVSWTVSNSAVGSVTPANGIIEVTGGATTMFTALAPGSTMVNATNGSVTGTAIVIVNVTPVLPVLTKITVSNASVVAGNATTFTATTLDQNNAPINATLTWNSSNISVGTINASTGVFSAISVGTSTITAKSANVTGTATATVTPSVTPVLPVLTKITVSNASVVVGNTTTFTATTLDQNNAPINATLTWNSSNISVGTINASTGVFTAISVGTSTITAKSANVTGTAIATVTVATMPPVVQNLILNPGFESGKTSWVFYTDGTGKFTINDSGYVGSKSAKIAINDPGTNTQLYQIRITLEPNTRYRLRFAARSTMGNDLSVELLKHVTPFTNYGLDKEFDLTPTWQEFSTEFTTSGFKNTVNNARLKFWLAPFAAAGEKYYIDDVRLEKVPIATSITKQPSNKTVKVGQTATFIVVATGTAPLTYQWQKNGVDIPGAINKSYTTSPTALSDSNSTFRVIVTNSLGSAISNDARLLVLPGVSNNLIKNSGFESGKSSWIFYTDGIGAFTAEGSGYVDLKSAKIAINDPATNTQLYQVGIKVEPNTHYRLTFAAKSTSGNDISVELLKHVPPFTNYGLDKEFDLTSNWQEFSTEFTTSGFTNIVDDGRLKFWLASFAQAGDVYNVDNVSLEKI